MTEILQQSVDMPIGKFADFHYVPWSSGIYPAYKGKPEKKEAAFFANLVEAHAARSIVDLAVGNGQELIGLVEELRAHNYPLHRIEANEVDDDLAAQALQAFQDHNLTVTLHRGDWLQMPDRVDPPYAAPIDFAILSGNSLTYVTGRTREEALALQEQVLLRFTKIMRPNGLLFIDTRNYDFIRTLANDDPEDLIERFRFDTNVYYHGMNRIRVIPILVTDTLVSLHYYDLQTRVWGKLDLFPIYQSDMLRMLERHFDIEAIYDDFEQIDRSTVKNHPERKSQFVQFLARKKQ